MDLKRSQKVVYQAYSKFLASNKLKTVSDILAQESSKDKAKTDSDAQNAKLDVNMTEAIEEPAADLDTAMRKAGSDEDENKNNLFDLFDDANAAQQFAPPPMTLRFE